MLPDKEAWSLRHPHAIFTLIFLCVLFLAFIFPDIWTIFIGAFHIREKSELYYPFLDMMGRLAAFEGHRAGVDMINFPNPFDPLQRPNAKPSWPLHLSFLGLSLDHLILMGTLTTVGVATLVTRLLKLKRWFEVPLMLLLCLSPGIMLGIERANDDLIYLLLLSTIPLALKWKSAMRVWLVWLVVFLLAPAKFYPGAAFAVLLLEIKSWRLLVGMMAIGGAFLAGYLYVSWEELSRLSEIVPRPVKFMVHGSPILAVATGWPVWLPKLVCGLLVLLGIAAIAAPRWPRLVAPLTHERWYVLGAAVWFFCYVVNSNFDYRLIYYIPMFPLILHLSRGEGGAAFWGRFALVWLFLLVPAFWVEIGMLHYFREANGEWSDSHLGLASAIKNLLLMLSAFCVVFVAATVLRPRVRELIGSFIQDVSSLLGKKSA